MSLIAICAIKRNRMPFAGATMPYGELLFAGAAKIRGKGSYRILDRSLCKLKG